MDDFPRSLSEFEHRLGDEAACAEYLAAARWPTGFTCPRCRSGKAWRLQTKLWTWECATCHRQTSVTAGTIMHHSKLPLTVWFWAAYVMATQPNGISALRLQHELALGSYKTAWLLCAKLRRSMAAVGQTPLSGLVEVAATEICCRRSRASATEQCEGNILVAAAVEVRELGIGQVRLCPLLDRSPAGLQSFLAENLAPGATVKTAGGCGCRGAPDSGRADEIVAAIATPAILPWLRRIFSDLELWGLGVYHGLRRRHLQSYLDEFVFRVDSRRTRYQAFPLLLRFAAVQQPVTRGALVWARAGA